MSRSVRKANKATASQLASSLVDTLVVNDATFRLKILASSDLSKEDRNAVWDLLEKNMRDLALNSSFGWDPSAKQEETFHKLSRFILVHRHDGSDAEDNAAGPLVAFSLFRFDREDGQDVVYCYELQVCETARRHGLGRHLMQQLVSIGKAWRMEKVMLTVLKANSDARGFYARLGFEVDPTSPGYAGADEDGWVGEDEDEEECDYEILSTIIQ